MYIWHKAMLLSRCPRCGGNLFFERERESWVVNCLQCSYERDIDISSGKEKIYNSLSPKITAKKKPAY
jgi:DNA-directed RNA polymerase subunit M/transcription elongation factor TFIIS